MTNITELVVGQSLEQHEWLVVEQSMINLFADATQDHQWIHIDTARCEAESPFKTTIAHGFLTASLMPQAFNALILVPDSVSQVINYGVDNVRFLHPVASKSAIRYHFSVDSIEEKPLGRLLKMNATCLIKDVVQPAMVGKFLMLIVPKPQ